MPEADDLTFIEVLRHPDPLIDRADQAIRSALQLRAEMEIAVAAARRNRTDLGRLRRAKMLIDLSRR